MNLTRILTLAFLCLSLTMVGTLSAQTTVNLSDQCDCKDATPPGIVSAFAGSTAPDGYLIADGSAVSRSTYGALFAVIGTTYGAGDGSTTFHLPDYRGQFLRGVSGASGADPDVAARTDRGDGTTGDAVGTKQAGAFQNHNHSADPPAANTNNSGNHNHSADPPATNTNTKGNHAHNKKIGTGFLMGGTTSGNNGHGNYSGNSTGIAWNGVGITNATASAGNHSHSVNIPAFNTSAAGNHSHSVNIPAFNTSTAGQSANETRPTNVSVVYIIKY